MRSVGLEEWIADRAGAGDVWAPWWGWVSRFWRYPAASLVFEHGSFAETVVQIDLIQAIPAPQIMPRIPGRAPQFDLKAGDAEALGEPTRFEAQTVDAFLAVDSPGEGEGDPVGVGADAGGFTRLWPQVEQAEGAGLPTIGCAG